MYTHTCIYIYIYTHISLYIYIYMILEACPLQRADQRDRPLPLPAFLAGADHGVVRHLSYSIV